MTVATPNRALSTPGQTMGELQDIQEQLGLVQNDHESNTATFAEAKWEMEIEMARARLDATGTVQERKDTALTEVAKDPLSAFRRFVVAESNYLETKVTVDLLTERASILQSLLKSQGRS